MTEYVIRLPWPPSALSPNSRVHWSRKAKSAAKYRRDCTIISQGAGCRALAWGGLSVSVNFLPPDNRARDTDNMLASIKSGLDGIADATGVDDSRWNYRLERGAPIKGGCVVVTVSEGPKSE